MCRLIESIKVAERQFNNLGYHNKRMNDTREQLFGCTSRLDLHKILSLPRDLNHETYKCRVEYDREIHRVEFMPYRPKRIQTLQLMVCDAVQYPFKFKKRQIFAALLAQKGNCDEILIVKNGRITDTSFSNIVFLTPEGEWITPATPLLKGTMREYLLDHHLITARDIQVGDLPLFSKAKLINAMLDLRSTDFIEIKNIRTTDVS